MNRLNAIKKTLIVGIVLWLTMPQLAHARGRIPVGTRDVIDIVYNIPASDSIIIDGKQVNLARMHKEFNVAYLLPLWVTEEPKLVLYDAPSETYYEMTTEKSRAFLKEYIKEKKLDEASLLKLGFYTRYGGKLVLLPIVALMIWGAIPSRKKDEKIEPTKL